MRATKDGGRAFPHPQAADPTGMTLRDYFAARAMHGLMDAALPVHLIATEAYRMADAMLKAREVS